MEKIFLHAIKTNYRWVTPFGNLNMEQLYSLNLEQLDEVAIALDDSLEEKKTKSFIKEKRNSFDTIVKNKLEIVKAIINHKQELIETANKRAELKAKREKLVEAIALKQNEEFNKKIEETSTEDLLAELKALDEEEYDN